MRIGILIHVGMFESNYYRIESPLREDIVVFEKGTYTPEEFDVTNPDDIKWMNPRLSPMPWHTHDQLLRITNPKAKVLPKSYICCTEFGITQFKAL